MKERDNMMLREIKRENFSTPHREANYFFFLSFSNLKRNKIVEGNEKQTIAEETSNNIPLLTETNIFKQQFELAVFLDLYFFPSFQVHQQPMTQTMQHPQQQTQPPLQPPQPPQQQQQPAQPQQDMVGGNSVVGLSPAPNGVSVSSASSANSPLTGVGPMGTDPSASSKEKTPMCLINELARYNKVCKGIQNIIEYVLRWWC